MATYTFETMTSEDAEGFLAGDTLSFSSTSATAGTVTVTNSALGFTTITSGGISLSFPAAELANAAAIKFTAGEDTYLSLGTSGNDTISIDEVNNGNYAYGFAGDDSIEGNSGADNIFGAAGDDTIQGFGGHDNIFGGAGDDSINGGDGNDHIYGFGLTGDPSTDGDDSIDGGAGNDYIQGNAGEDTLDGGNDSDRINGGADNDVIYGSDGNDTVNGNKGEDDIEGNSGNDSLRGGADNDTVSGDSGNDVILGDLGDDFIDGGDGIDLLTGGAGDDVFFFDVGDVGTPETEDEDSDVFGLVDTITDFTDGEDLLDLPTTIGQAADSADVLHATDGITLSSLTAATVYAQQLLDNNDGSVVDIAALQVGADTYLFYNDAAGATINSVIKLSGVDAADITSDDIVGAA